MISKQCLEMFQRNPDEFLRRFITVDETCSLLHIRNEVKTMDFISFEEGEDRKVGQKDDGHNFLGCTRYNSYQLPSKQNINGDYYAALLDHCNNILKKKCFHLAKKKMLFHQDNAHVALMAKFNEFRYELFPHSTYSSDLAPCDYFLFPIPGSKT